MTKTLTEQWKDGEVDDGLYYFKLPSGKTTITSKWGISGSAWKDTKDEIEVLAPVPSYDEWKQAKENLDKNGTWYTERSYKRIEKKLEIATKALKEYMTFCRHPAEEALKEMEGVK